MLVSCKFHSKWGGDLSSMWKEIVGVYYINLENTINMNLEEAYNHLHNSRRREKENELFMHGYKLVKCNVCNGSGKVHDIVKSVYHLIPEGIWDRCHKCKGEGGFWVQPTAK